MAVNKSCVIDANCLVLYVFDVYAGGGSARPSLPQQQADDAFGLLQGNHFPAAGRADFRALFKEYPVYITSSYIIHEVEHILQSRLKNLAINPNEVFESGAELFRVAKEAKDFHIGYVQVVDLPYSQRIWGAQKALYRFNIADMSLITLAQELAMPILTLDRPLIEFIETELYSSIRFVDVRQKLP